MLFTGLVAACTQMLEVVGAKAYGAGPFEIACVRSGMGLGMIASFLVAVRVGNRPRVPFVIYPQLISRLLLLCLLATPFLPQGVLLPFFCFCISCSLALEHMIHPARITLYRHNYPQALRPLVASRIRQAQMLMILFAGALLGLFLDWNSLAPEGLGDWLASIVSPDILPRGVLIKYGIPLIAGSALLGVFFFGKIKEKNDAYNNNHPRPGIKDWIRVLTQDKSFFVFELAYFLFGFGNLMTLPLMVILITSPEYGINATYFEAMLLQTVIWQAGILVAAPLMSRLVLKYNPLFLRGIFTLIFSLDLFLLYYGYATQSISPLYFGKILRGIVMGGGILLWELGPLYFAKDKIKAPTYIGIHTVLTGVRAMISPLAGASIAVALSMGTAILLGAGLQIVAGIMLLLYFVFSKREKLILKKDHEDQVGEDAPPVT